MTNDPRLVALFGLSLSAIHLARDRLITGEDLQAITDLIQSLIDRAKESHDAA
ncbi:hypothetical protein [Methylobacterium sp. Leaf91]|uniref:hypothetical protein n=1 Tax=Methylobacterium sp. Leaf91 TaxID=1736247 RepID=UPI000AF6FC40|nr:hypothetical protein [Methylobacterium sp. Leaf91]